MRRMLIRLATWVLRRFDALPAPVVTVPTPPEVEPYLAEVRAQTQVVSAAPQSGEWKRHQVYATLLKTFPAARSRDLALAIEWALRPEES